MKRTLQALAESLGCQLIGDGTAEVAAVASLHSAGKESLVFVDDPKNLDSALKSAAGGVLAGEFAVSAKSSKPRLIHPQPRHAFARAAKLLDNQKQAAGTHASAIVARSARIGQNVAIGAGCVIGEGVVIGDDCRLDPNVTVYAGTTLGNRVTVQAGAVLGSEGFGYVRDPQTGRYEQFPQVGRLVIEDDVDIGANSTIDRGALDETRIGRGTKIDNLVHIGHNVQVGRDIVIAAQTGISGSAVLEDNVIVGGQVGIADHVRIEEGAILGAQSGIPSKKVIRGKGVVFWGTPARPLRDYLKELAFLSRAAKKDA